MMSVETLVKKVRSCDTINIVDVHDCKERWESKNDRCFYNEYFVKYICTF